MSHLQLSLYFLYLRAVRNLKKQPWDEAQHLSKDRPSFLEAWQPHVGGVHLSVLVIMAISNDDFCLNNFHLFKNYFLFSSQKPASHPFSVNHIFYLNRLRIINLEIYFRILILSYTITDVLSRACILNFQTKYSQINFFMVISMIIGMISHLLLNNTDLKKIFSWMYKCIILIHISWSFWNWDSTCKRTLYKLFWIC